MKVGDDWCAYHQRPEPIGRGLPGARTCGECWHWFRSGLHLRVAYLLTARRVLGIIRWRFLCEPIWVCPYCAHDF